MSCEFDLAAKRLNSTSDSHPTKFCTFAHMAHYFTIDIHTHIIGNAPLDEVVWLMTSQSGDTIEKQFFFEF
jgi:hypothetical protein